LKINKRNIFKNGWFDRFKSSLKGVFFSVKTPFLSTNPDPKSLEIPFFLGFGGLQKLKNDCFDHSKDPLKGVFFSVKNPFLSTNPDPKSSKNF